MKRVLCYGDSNTWGTIPDGSCGHCDLKDRYASKLQNLLGENYDVICEGLPARTTDLDDIKFPKGNRNGSIFYPQCLISHDPVNFIIIFLGTNDLKSKFNRETEQIAKAIEEKYIKFTQNELLKEITYIPKIIIVAPSIVNEQDFEGFEGATKKSLLFDSVYKKMAERNDCFFVSNKYLKVGDDGIHLTKDSHEVLANELAKIILSVN